MGNASDVSPGYSGAVFDAILADRRLKRTKRMSVNHVTRFYLREISFVLTIFLST